MTKYAAGRYHRASGTRNAFQAWGADLVAEGYPEPVVNSGDREEALQEQIFREAYVPSSGPKDVGPFNDRRFWPGHGYWKRVGGNATIAAPGASNHEKRRASDLAYPYDRDTPAHRRGLVFAKRHNITCEGMGFREWWHWTFWGPLGTIDQPGTAGGGSSTPEEGFLMGLSDYDQLLVKNAVVDINNRTADMAAAMAKSDAHVAALHALYAERDSNGWSWADVVKSHVVATLSELRSAGVVNGSVDLDALTKRIVDEQAKRLTS